MVFKHIKYIEFVNGEKRICNTRKQIYEIVNKYVENHNKNNPDGDKIFGLGKTTLNSLMYNKQKSKSIEKYTPYIIKYYDASYPNYFNDIDFSSVKIKDSFNNRLYNEEYIIKQKYKLQKEAFKTLTPEDIDLSKMVCYYDSS